MNKDRRDIPWSIVAIAGFGDMSFRTCEDHRLSHDPTSEMTFRSTESYIMLFG